MKKHLSVIVSLFMAFAATAAPVPDIQDILRGLGGGKSEQSGKSDQTDQTDKSGSSILDALTGVGNALGIIPSKTVDVAYLTGTWSYQKPAVAFKSDNFLAKAGGVAASAKIEGELAPYYKRFGFDKMTLEVESDSTFVMQFSRMKLKGSITTEKSADASRLIFHFNVMGKNLTSMEAYVNAESSSVMSLTFDVSKLMTVAKFVGSMTGGTIGSMTKLLDNYEGLTAGFKLKKTSK